jgi:hypothetical protein
VYVAGLKDRNRGLQQFVEALKIDGNVKLDAERSSPELQEAFDEAVKKVGAQAPKKPPRKPVETGGGEAAGGATGEGGDQGAAEAAPEVHGLVHTSIDEAKAGDAVEIKAQLGTDVAASKVFLFYRGGGQEDYATAPMTQGTTARKKNEWTAVIPSEVVQGKTVQYYLEARDDRGRPVIGSGSASSPYIITIRTPVVEPKRQRTGTEENPLQQFNKAGMEGGDRGYGRMFIHLMIGTDAGVEIGGNRVDTAYQYQSKTFKPVTVTSSGFVSGPLHGTLEIGGNINRHLALSGLVRIEGTLVNNADATDNAVLKDDSGKLVYDSKNTIAPMGLLRIKYTFGDSRFRPGIHVDVGGGVIRHVFDISSVATGPPLVDSVTATAWNGRGGDPYASGQINKVCPGTGNCVDTITIGYVFAGLGLNLYYDVAKFKNGGFGILFDLTALTGFGGNQFGVNFDLSLGLGAHFM